jgi:hypothetical protein
VGDLTVSLPEPVHCIWEMTQEGGTLCVSVLPRYGGGLGSVSTAPTILSICLEAGLISRYTGAFYYA